MDGPAADLDKDAAEIGIAVTTSLNTSCWYAHRIRGLSCNTSAVRIEGGIKQYRYSAYFTHGSPPLKKKLFDADSREQSVAEEALEVLRRPRRRALGTRLRDRGGHGAEATSGALDV